MTIRFQCIATISGKLVGLYHGEEIPAGYKLVWVRREKP